MAERWIALLRRDDYEAFRRLLGNNLPDAYNEWQHLMEDEVHGVTRGGHRSRGIEIDPDEFAAWLTTHGNDRTMNGLRNFAFIKGTEAHED